MPRRLRLFGLKIGIKCRNRRDSDHDHDHDKKKKSAETTASSCDVLSDESKNSMSAAATTTTMMGAAVATTATTKEIVHSEETASVQTVNSVPSAPYRTPLTLLPHPTQQHDGTGAQAMSVGMDEMQELLQPHGEENDADNVETTTAAMVVEEKTKEEETKQSLEAEEKGEVTKPIEEKTKDVEAKPAEESKDENEDETKKSIHLLLITTVDPSSSPVNNNDIINVDGSKSTGSAGGGSKPVLEEEESKTEEEKDQVTEICLLATVTANNPLPSLPLNEMVIDVDDGADDDDGTSTGCDKAIAESIHLLTTTTSPPVPVKNEINDDTTNDAEPRDEVDTETPKEEEEKPKDDSTESSCQPDSTVTPLKGRILRMEDVTPRQQQQHVMRSPLGTPNSRDNDEISWHPNLAVAFAGTTTTTPPPSARTRVFIPGDDTPQFRNYKKENAQSGGASINSVSGSSPSSFRASNSISGSSPFSFKARPTPNSNNRNTPNRVSSSVSVSRYSSYSPRNAHDVVDGPPLVLHVTTHRYNNDNNNNNDDCQSVSSTLTGGGRSVRSSPCRPSFKARPMPRFNESPKIPVKHQRGPIITTKGSSSSDLMKVSASSRCMETEGGRQQSVK